MEIKISKKFDNKMAFIKAKLDQHYARFCFKSRVSQFHGSPKTQDKTKKSDSIQDKTHDKTS